MEVNQGCVRSQFYDGACLRKCPRYSDLKERNATLGEDRPITVGLDSGSPKRLIRPLFAHSTN
jgi:hypothetical protein